MKLTEEKFISLDEEIKLFETLTKANDKASLVDKMLFQLLTLTGLRISEALALKWDDIGEDYLIVRNQKNEKSDGIVHLGNKLIDLLASFKIKNPYSYSSYLLNTQKGPYKRSNAHERLKYWLKKSELRQTISLHSFRHTYATRCLDAGLSISLVRDQLRHSSISVTSVYLQFSRENKEKMNFKKEMMRKIF